MSAGGLARLGIRCADASTGIATIGIFCGAFVPPPEPVDKPGGGESRRRRIDLPTEHPNKRIAMMEDEEFVAIIQALLDKRH